MGHAFLIMTQNPEAKKEEIGTFKILNQGRKMLPGKTHHKAKKYLQLLSQTRDFCNMEYFQITNIIT